MSISDASKELFKTLRDCNGVVGTGVVSKNDKSYIVVYLEKTKSFWKRRNLRKQIPPTFKGNSVKAKFSSPFFGF
jgi:hypothetical protein